MGTYISKIPEGSLLHDAALALLLVILPVCANLRPRSGKAVCCHQFLGITSPQVACLCPPHISENRAVIKLLESPNLECFPAGILIIRLKGPNCHDKQMKIPETKRSSPRSRAVVRGSCD